MAKQRYINTKFWSDNYIVNLDPVEKLLFLYFLTNEHTSICGIYELSLKTMAFETGIEKEMIDRILPRFKDKIYYVRGWVIICNFVKHQTNSPKILKGIEIALSGVPTVILAQLDTLSIPYVYGSNYSNTNTNSNNIGDKSPDVSTNMENDEIYYEEDSGSVPKKYGNRKKLYKSIVLYYMKETNRQGNALAHYKGCKEVVDQFFSEFPSDSDADAEREILNRIDIANWYYSKANLDWSLRKLAENWEKTKEWNKQKLKSY